MIIRKVKVTEYEYQAPINYVAGATEPDIQFQLTDYEIPSGATGRVYVGRSDGTFEYTVATISGNNVTVAPTSSMFSVKGPGAIQVTLYVGNEVVKNFAVPVYVHADLADDSAEAGSDVTGVFRAAEEQALADFAEDAEAKAAEVIESIPADYTELTDEVSELNERLDNLDPFSEDAKVALLNCFQHVGWIDEHGQDYYDALREALYPDSIVSITAVLQLGTNQIFTNDSLDYVKQYLTVTANYADGTQGVITTYDLSGDISTEGTKTITVSANEKTTTFECPVVWGYRLTSPDDIARGTLKFNYSQYDYIPYFDINGTNRYSTIPYLPWETGYDCYVEADTELNVVASVNVFNQTAMNAVSANKNIASSNVGLPGWQTTNPSLTVIPDTVNNSPSKTIRITFKTVPTEQAFSENSITEVRITRRAKA